MLDNLYTVVAIAYVGYVLYILTEPMHDEIQEVVTDYIRKTRKVWEQGTFYMQAKIDTIIITEGM